METRRPNLLFIFSDQHRYCDVGYMGNAEVETPALDRLAQAGAYFTSAYSNYPLCVPARGTILTGTHALKHGAAANDLPIRSDSPSIAKALKGAGYQTAYIGKWHLGGTPRDKFIMEEERLGFEYWNGYNCNHSYFEGYYDDYEHCRHKISGYEPEGLTNRALEYLENVADGDRPWGLWLSYGTPHPPYDQVPEGDLEYCLSKQITIRENVTDELQDQIFGGAKPDLRAMYAGYYAHIRRLDMEIARLIDYLERSGQIDNTIIVYTSDHGDMLGSHGYYEKQLYYNESARIPLIISWPRKIISGERKSSISLVDLMPTLLGLIEVECPEGIDGSDESNVLLNPDAKGQEYVYFYSYIPCHMAAIRKVMSWRAVSDGNLVYVVDEMGEEIALYDDSADPLQRINLKDDSRYADQKLRLRSVLDSLVKKHDGYIAWDELLAEHDLLQAWDASQQYFNELWKWNLPSRRNELLQFHRMVEESRVAK
jgi:arylsulfatase A-like enzyme